MRKLLLPVAALVTLVWYSSCSKDQAQQPSTIDCSTVDPSTNTYTLNIKTILDNNCTTTGCHDAVFASSGINLSTYADAKSAFEGGRVLGAVKHEQGYLPMPQTGGKLADSLITYLQCWKENNYPQ